MFKPIERLRRSWREFVAYDPEAAALEEAVDRIDVEMIHRSFARQRSGRQRY